MLIVDDNADYCCLLSKTLEQRIRAHTTSVLSGKLALDALKTNKFDVMICDFEMPVMKGLEVFQAMRSEGLFCPFLLYTNADLNTLPKFEGPGFLGMVRKMEVEKLLGHLGLLLRTAK